MGVSRDNGASDMLLEVNDQLYECLTKHFKVFITGMKPILWSSMSHNFIGGDNLFTKKLVFHGKRPGSQTLRKSPRSLCFLSVPFSLEYIMIIHPFSREFSVKGILSGIMGLY